MIRGPGTPRMLCVGGRSRKRLRAGGVCYTVASFLQLTGANFHQSTQISAEDYRVKAVMMTAVKPED